MNRTRLHLASISLVGLVLVACGPTTSADLAIRPDYTSEGAIKAFQQRYRMAKQLPPGPPVTVQETNVQYASLQQASAEAPDGATLVLGEGYYRDAFQVTGKSLRILGQGRFKTLLMSPESVGLVQQGTLEIRDLTLASLSVKQDVSVVGVVDGVLNMQECRITGGTGPGMIVAGESDVRLLANTFLGNMGGGLRVQGGSVEMRRNVLVRNAVAGVIVAPSKPAAITRLTLWHDVVLDNWAGYRCQAFAKSGIVPLSGKEVIKAEASIINSGGLAEAFSEPVAQRIKNDGYNFVSTPPLPIADFFINYDQEDFRPKGALKTDELGVELGAWPSDEGQQRALSLLTISLQSERLREAYLLSNFCPYSDREAVARSIQELVAFWTGEFLQHGRLGARLVTVLNLAQVAPASWRMDVILQRLMEGFVDKYTFVLRPLSFFEQDPAVSQAAFAFLGEHLTAFPRFLTVTGESPNAFVLGGRVTAPFKVAKSVRPFRLDEQVANPNYPKLVEALRLAKSRQAEAEKKRKELQDTVDSPHFKQKVGENSKHMANLRKQLTKLEEELASLDTSIKTLNAQLERSPEQFHIVVQGKEHRTQVTGEFSAQLVAAPAGEILLDATRSLDLASSQVEAQGVPLFGYEGTKAAASELDVPKELGKEIGRLLLEAFLATEVTTLRSLLLKFDDGVINTEEEDQLIELVLLNAVLIKDSAPAAVEYEQLTGTKPTEEVRLKVDFDDRKGSGPESVQLAVKGGDADGAVARIRYLKSVYEPYWQLQKSIDRFLSVRFGLTRDDLTDLRARMDRLGPQRNAPLQ